MNAAPTSINGARSTSWVRGFTLIELLVTMGIAAILAALAAPNLQRFLLRQAVTANTEAFMSSVRMARAEAMKRGAAVTMCPMQAGSATDATSAVCVATASSWGNGWKVTDGSTVISVYQELGHTGSVTPTSLGITFQPSGIAMGGQSSFLFTPKGGDTSLSKKVCIASTGRARVVESTSCSS